MTDAASPAAKSFRPQFTLRRMLVAIFLLGIALGVGRWIYVRTILQRQVVMELHNLETGIRYRSLYPMNDGNPRYGYRNQSLPLGYVVDDITLRLPYASEAEAKRVNRLLRHLPHLRTVHLQTRGKHYRISAAEHGDRHAALALSGLSIDDLRIRSIDVGPEVTALVCNFPSLRRLSIGYRPAVEQLRSICQVQHLESLSISGSLTDEQLEILATAKQLKTLNLISPGRYYRLAPLGLLEHCDLHLYASDATDREIEESLATLPNLTQLSLLMPVVSDETAAALAASPRLQHLSLECAIISDRAVASLAKSRSLEFVDLCGTNVSEQAVVLLAQGPAMRKIYVPDRIDALALRPQVPAAVVVSPLVTMHAASRQEKLAAIEQEQAAAAKTPKP